MCHRLAEVFVIVFWSACDAHESVAPGTGAEFTYVIENRLCAMDARQLSAVADQVLGLMPCCVQMPKVFYDAFCIAADDVGLPIFFLLFCERRVWNCRRQYDAVFKL